MSLKRVLDARSVAIIGASRDEKKRGFQVVRSLIESRFEGPIYPVNPREETVLGLPCYRSVRDIENSVDIVLIATPAETIPAILEECGEKGVAGAVIVAAGFGEVGANVVSGRWGRQGSAMLVHPPKGAYKSMDIPSKSSVFRVTSVAPRSRAVAAIMQSGRRV